MKSFTIKTLTLAVALALPFAGGAVFAQGKPEDAGKPPLSAPDKPAKPEKPGDKPMLLAPAEKAKKASAILNKVLGKPGSRPGLIKANKQVFYAGDTMTIELALPASLKPLLNKQAEAQVLMYVPGGSAVAFPVKMLGEGRLVESVIDTSAIPAGVYQLALVLVKPGGDAAKIGDWYEGFGALVSVTRIKISAEAAADVEDADGDGMVDGDMGGDGFVDEVVDGEDTSEWDYLFDDEEEAEGDTGESEEPTEEPAAEEPASEEPAAEEPASEEPAAEEPASEEPAETSAEEGSETEEDEEAEAA
ncbi:hypothetical protein [Thioflexithrix psekupsensis]|uniref:Uncharacterized protein n=1 Tax=Thioflexithrix psekupsensis TaxID=1570016 RepID=A0A251X4L7_9GAMM|nr:hypothetical protein [Thioflexithrix psekupsensis]OUD12139.1 hypothetical protein TPSD3_13510 [Thioflexithrix psekupsensis]